MSQIPRKEKYIITLGNQDLNDFLLETLAWTK